MDWPMAHLQPSGVRYLQVKVEEAVGPSQLVPQCLDLILVFLLNDRSLVPCARPFVAELVPLV